MRERIFAGRVGIRAYRCPACAKRMAEICPTPQLGPLSWDGWFADGVKYETPYAFPPLAEDSRARALDITCTCGAQYHWQRVMEDLYPRLEVHPANPQAKPEEAQPPASSEPPARANPMAGRPAR